MIPPALAAASTEQSPKATRLKMLVHVAVPSLEYLALSPPTPCFTPVYKAPIGYGAAQPLINNEPANKEATNNPFFHHLILTKNQQKWSGKRGSNPRPQPWQGCALPLSYSRKTNESEEL